MGNYFFFFCLLTMRIPFLPKSLRNWVHPDTAILGVVLGVAVGGCAWFSLKTLFGHTDVNIYKTQTRLPGCTDPVDKIYSRDALVDHKHRVCEPRTARYSRQE